MQPDTKFQIISKDVQKPEGKKIEPLREVKIQLQKEGSASISHSGVISQHHFAEELEAVIVQMRESEQWTIKDPKGINFTINLSSIGELVDSRTPFEKAQTFKAEGNAFIKARENGKAIEAYTKAYDLLLNDSSAQAQQLKLSIVSNLALASLNLNDFKSALSWCDMHLEQTVKPNVKLIFRKASANRGLKDWWAARRDINFGISQSGGDDETVKSFNNLMTQIQKEQKQQKAKEKQVYGKMFG